MASLQIQADSVTAVRARSSVGLPNIPILKHRGPNRRSRARDAEAPDLGAMLRQDLIDTVNHVFRTPLTMVVGLSEILHAGDAGQLNELQRSMIDKVALNGLHLLELVEGLVSATSDCLTTDQPGNLAAVMHQVFGSCSQR
jgi:signal transduction histidine kinase